VSERAPYSRVYWEIADDPKFATVFDSDANLAAWLRLLLIADQAYPASGNLPTNCKRAAFRALEEAGLITLTGSRFRISGLEAERQRRSRSGPRGHQLVPNKSPVGNTDKTSQDEDETSQDATEARDPADIYWQLTGRYPVEKALTWIDNLTEQYGAEDVIAALAGSFLEDRSTQTLLGRTKDRLASKVRKLDLAERAAEKQRIAEKRAKPPEEVELTEDEIRAMADAYRENHAA
jgi:hypothetical protein